MKNRMLEIGASGSVRGEDGNILTYSAIDLAQRRHVRLEGSDVIEAGVDAEKLETSGPVGGDEFGQEQSPEQAGENLYGQDKVWPARDPPRAINGDAAARHDHVDVRVMGHG